MDNFIEKIDGFIDRTAIEEVWSLKSFQKLRQYLNSGKSNMLAIEIAYDLIKKPKKSSIRHHLFNTIDKLKSAPVPINNHDKTVVFL